MAKYKKYDYDQMVMLPISLENQLTPGTLEFGIHTVVETCMDLSLFDEKYKNDETGRFAYDPKILLKIMLFAYSRGLTGSRGTEQACRENVIFMALACGEKPDHSTIAAFVSSMKDEIMPLFRDVLLVCDEEGLLGGSFFALDGVKLPSNASKQWSGKLSELQRKKEKLESKVKRLLKEHEQEDEGDDEPPGPGSFRGSKRKYLWVPIAVQLINLSRKMAGKIDTTTGRKIYPRRIAIVEPVFANIRTHKRLDHFTLRSKIKVDIQWMLYCMVHNIGKIVNYGST